MSSCKYNSLGEKTDMKMDVILAILWAVWRERNMFIFQEVKEESNRAGMKALSWINTSVHYIRRKVVDL